MEPCNSIVMLNEKESWLCKYRIFKVNGSFHSGQPMSELIRSDLKERKVSRDLAKDRNA